MAFRERMAWLSLVATVVVYGAYFSLFVGALRGGGGDGVDFFILFICSVVALAAGHAAFAIWGALASRTEARTPADERERGIALKASAVAFYFLVTLVLTIAALSPVAAVAGEFVGAMSHAENATFLMSNALLLAAVIAELARNVSTIVLYRLGGGD